MKLICVCSALDLGYRFGCTPHWWQFLKGLHEEGHEVIAMSYAGGTPETLWWRTAPNPCRAEGDLFRAARSLLGGKARETGGKAAGLMLEHRVRPAWRTALSQLLERERDTAALIFFSVPPNHLLGVPGWIRDRHHVPVFFFDGDAPASLPAHGGFASGFRIYDGADLAEYDGVMCNSEGALDDLRQLGARRVEAVHWGVDPALYEPLPVEEDRDVFFYGYGSEYREEWMESMLGAPSLSLPDTSFVVAGKGFSGRLGRVRFAGDVPFSRFRQACMRSRINLCVTRSAHASVMASSTARPFELAAMGRCMVCNPAEGLDTWFDTTTDLAVVHSADDAADTYRRLLGDPAARAAMGASARRTVLERHTHRHRARQIAAFVSSV
jgi:hypothetical protein